MQINQFQSPVIPRRVMTKINEAKAPISDVKPLVIKDGGSKYRVIDRYSNRIVEDITCGKVTGHWIMRKE